MRKGVLGPGVMVAIILGVIFILIVVFQSPGLMDYINKTFFGGLFKPFEKKVEGTTSGYVIDYFQLDSNAAKASSELADAAIRCWSKFENSGFTDQVCFEVDPPASFYTQTGLGYQAVTEVDFRDQLSFKNVKGDYTWNLGKFISANGPTFWICADDDGINEVVLTYSPDSGDCK